MTFQSILDEIRNNLNGILSDLGITDVSFSVEPAKPGFGDVTSNIAFLLAKRLKQNPFDIAQMISEKYTSCVSTLVHTSNAHRSGYLNFFADWDKLNELIVCESYLDTFGDVDIGKGSTITVEHTSVNPNKALHIGHVRNIVIGDTMSRILEKSNYHVNVLNYIDDSGLQVADILLGFRHFKYDLTPPDGKKFDHYCGDDIYVKTTLQIERDPSLESVRRDILKELEDGTSDTARFADKITRRVLAGQLETCWNLGVSYDCLNFESQIIRSGLWAQIFEKLKTMGLIEFETEGDNTGCWVIRGDDGNSSNSSNRKQHSSNDDTGNADVAAVDDDDDDDDDADGNNNRNDGSDTNSTNTNSTTNTYAGNPDTVIIRSNGTATYIAKDIPYAAWKLGLVDDPFTYTKYDPSQQPATRTLWQTGLATPDADSIKKDFTASRVITVIDSRQAGLQKIITLLMDRFKSTSDAYIHLGYESVILSSDTADMLGLDTGGRQVQMSGRKGLYVSADSVYDMLKTRSTEETKKRHPDISDTEIGEIAHSVSVGTLRYEMIKQDLDKIITFDLKKSLSLDGDTAPYIQYTFVRALRILERSQRTPSIDVDFSQLKEPSELHLVQSIGLFDLRVRDAANNLSPKVIARYCHDLAVSFNSFYENVKVLNLDDDSVESARLCLVNSFKITLEKALLLLGIRVPNMM